MTQEDIIDLVRDYTGTHDHPEASYPEERVLRHMNLWLDRLVTWIEEVSSLWDFDDENYDEFSIAHTDLVEGQNNYQLPHSMLKIERVEIKNKSGNSHKKLEPRDQRKIERPMEDMSDGTPSYYDLRGNHLLLYPAPDYDKAKALHVIYTRLPEQFESGKDNFTPGISRNFRPIIAMGAAKEYCVANVNGEKRASLERQIQEQKLELERFYGNRAKERGKRLMPESPGKTSQYQT